MGNYSLLIYKKEMKDIFRDRRSLLTTLVLPLVIYPLIFYFMGSSINSVVDDAEQNATVAFYQTTDTAKLKEVFNSPGLDDDTEIKIVETSDPLLSLENGDVNALIKIDGGNITIIQDDSKTISTTVANLVWSKLELYNSIEQAKELAKLGISLDALTPYTITSDTLTNINGEDQKNAGLMLSMILPMIVVIFLAVGGMPTAVDLFAGEKERRTFEPLLCTKAKRGDILTGKLGAVVTIAILSVISCLIGLFLGYKVSPESMTMGIGEESSEVVGSILGLSISPIMLILSALVLLSTAIIFSGLHILLSTWSRSIKEASTYGSFVMLASYVPVFTTMAKQGGDFELWTSFVPVLNSIASLKMVLSGITNIPYLLITLGVSVVIVAIVLVCGKIMFNKETIMLRA